MNYAAANPDLMQLRRLVGASVKREPGGESHIISNHFNQIEDLMIGQGVDFAPEADPAGDRGPFVTRLTQQTRIQSYLSDIIRKTMGTGEVLLWLRFAPTGYRIRYYAFDEFRPFYNPGTDDLFAAVIVSMYTEEKQGRTVPKWLKVVVLAEGSFVEVSDRRPQIHGIGKQEQWSVFDAPPMTGDQAKGVLGDNVQFFPNPFDFLPLVVLKNRDVGPGQRAKDDFSEFAAQLVSHDRTMKAIGNNVRKYARQSVFTNLPRNQIMRGRNSDPGGSRMYGNSGTFASEYYDAAQMAANRAGRSQGGTEEIADIIGVEGLAGENFLQVIDWNPIQGDQLTYLEILEDKLHWAMGSVSKRGGGTAYEVRANLAWSQATANKKAQNIFTDGICRVMEMAIAHEEKIFELTRGAMGLIPAGDRTVRYRRIELVQPTPQDQLQLSILGRNLEEEGVGQKEILKLLFPSKTDKEIQAMTGGAGGVPFRKLEKTIPQVVQIVQTAIALGPAGETMLPIAELLLQNLMEAVQYGRTIPGATDPDNRTTLPGDSLSALIAAARASTAGPDPSADPAAESDGMVSGDDQQSAQLPASGASPGNPIAAAFGNLADLSRSPILRAIGAVRR